MSRRFVSDHAGRYPVTRLCVLVDVPRSSFYAWRNRPASRRVLDDAVLADEIVEVHRASQGTYGAPRVHGQLRHRGWRVGRKRVARLMAAHGLVGVHGRRKWRRGKPNTAPAPDLLQGDFTAEASDQRWVADITEFACWDGTLFLAGIKDLHDQSIVGWSMGVRQTTDLVVNALVMALGRRHPDGDLVHHADRGSQGGFKWSSQHLEMEVFDGTTTGMDGDVDGASGDAVTGSAASSTRLGAGVLGEDRRGAVQRGRGDRLWGIGSGRVALVPRAWWDAFDPAQRSVGQVSVVR